MRNLSVGGPNIHVGPRIPINPGVRYSPNLHYGPVVEDRIYNGPPPSHRPPPERAAKKPPRSAADPTYVPNEVLIEIAGQPTDAQVRERFAALGQDIPPPAQQTPQALAAHHKAEADLWWPLIKAAGIKIE